MATFETKNIHTSAADLFPIRIANLDWNESHKKETKDIHASAANLLSIRIGRSTGANADIAKTKREKYIAFVVEKWVQCFIASAKIP